MHAEGGGWRGDEVQHLCLRARAARSGDGERYVVIALRTVLVVRVLLGRSVAVAEVPQPTGDVAGRLVRPDDGQAIALDAAAEVDVRRGDTGTRRRGRRIGRRAEIQRRTGRQVPRQGGAGGRCRRGRGRRLDEDRQATTVVCRSRRAGCSTGCCSTAGCPAATRRRRRPRTAGRQSGRRQWRARLVRHRVSGRRVDR